MHKSLVDGNLPFPYRNRRLMVIRMGCQLKSMPSSVLENLIPFLKTAAQTIVVITKVTPMSYRIFVKSSVSV